MMEGLDRLDRMDGVTILTNTVVTRLSFADLPSIVEALAHLQRLRRMDFWIYFPMKEDDERDLIAGYPE